MGKGGNKLGEKRDSGRAVLYEEDLYIVPVSDTRGQVSICGHWSGKLNEEHNVVCGCTGCLKTIQISSLKSLPKATSNHTLVDASNISITPSLLDSRTHVLSDVARAYKAFVQDLQEELYDARSSKGLDEDMIQKVRNFHNHPPLAPTSKPRKKEEQERKKFENILTFAYAYDKCVNIMSDLWSSHINSVERSYKELTQDPKWKRCFDELSKSRDVSLPLMVRIYKSELESRALKWMTQDLEDQKALGSAFGNLIDYYIDNHDLLQDFHISEARLNQPLRLYSDHADSWLEEMKAQHDKERSKLSDWASTIFMEDHELDLADNSAVEISEFYNQICEMAVNRDESGFLDKLSLAMSAERRKEEAIRRSELESRKSKRRERFNTMPTSIRKEPPNTFQVFVRCSQETLRNLEDYSAYELAEEEKKLNWENSLRKFNSSVEKRRPKEFVPSYTKTPGKTLAQLCAEWNWKHKGGDINQRSIDEKRSQHSQEIKIQEKATMRLNSVSNYDLGLTSHLTANEESHKPIKPSLLDQQPWEPDFTSKSRLELYLANASDRPEKLLQNDAYRTSKQARQSRFKPIPLQGYFPADDPAVATSSKVETVLTPPPERNANNPLREAGKEARNGDYRSLRKSSSMSDLVIEDQANAADSEIMSCKVNQGTVGGSDSEVVIEQAQRIGGGDESLLDMLKIRIINKRTMDDSVLLGCSISRGDLSDSVSAAGNESTPDTSDDESDDEDVTFIIG